MREGWPLSPLGVSGSCAEASGRSALAPSMCGSAGVMAFFVAFRCHAADLDVATTFGAPVSLDVMYG